MSLLRRVVKPQYLHLAWYHPTDAQQWKGSVLKACHVYWSNTKRLGMAQTLRIWHTYDLEVFTFHTLWNYLGHNFLSISRFSLDLWALFWSREFIWSVWELVPFGWSPWCDWNLQWENYFPRCPCSLQDVFYHDIIGFVSVPMFENGHFDPLCHDRIWISAPLFSIGWWNTTG